MMKEIIKKFCENDFIPFVEYKNNSIRVECSDCSMFEDIIDDQLTILRSNTNSQIVGFELNGIKQLIK